MGVISDIVGLFTAGSAAENQLTSTRDAQSVLDKYYGQAQGYQQPYYEGGTKAFRRLGDLTESGAFDMQSQEYAPEKFNFEADPGYQFRLGEGQRAVESSAAAKGNYLSGATLKALSRYNQGFASNEYANAFGRFNTNRNFAYNNFIDSYNRRSDEMTGRYNRLSGIANIGVGAAANLGNLSTGLGGLTAQNIYNRGNIEANRTMRQGEAIGNIGDEALNAAVSYGTGIPTLGNTGGGSSSNMGYMPQYEDNVGFGANQRYYLGR